MENKLLSKSVNEIMEMIQEEIKEINSTPVVVTQPKWGFEESESAYIDYSSAFDVIEEMEQDRLFDRFEREQTHKPILMKFDKLHNYNKLHCNVTHQTNDLYRSYSKEILSQLTQEVIDILKSGYFKLEVSFYIINRNQDLDNLDEAFNEMIVGNFKKAIIDTIFKKAEINDNHIKSMTTKISKSFTGFEFLLLRVTRLSNHEFYHDPLLEEFYKNGGIIK